jgi:hypothetical protein
VNPVVWIAVAVLFVTGSVNLEVPLYGTYARAAGVGTGVTAIVFALYVAGLLPVLILFGGISDRIGRKRTILLGLCASCAATTLVFLWPGFAALLPARLLQGVGVGLTVSAATAYIAELSHADPARAARLIAPSTALGFGGGALVTTLALAATLATTPLTYPLMIAGCIAAFSGVLVFCPPLQPVGGALVRLPLVTARTLPAGIAIAIAWAVSGVVVAVVPAQLAEHGLGMWAGPVLFLVNAAGVLVQPWARSLPAQRSMLIGLAVVPVGYALMVTGAALQQLPWVLLGACICGTGCYGFTYLGGLASVSNAAGAARARAVAGYFLFAYLGFGIPSILVGYAADRLGTTWALGIFGCLLVAASSSLALLLRRPAAPHISLTEGSSSPRARRQMT